MFMNQGIIVMNDEIIEKKHKREIISAADLMPEGEKEKQILFSRSEKLSKKSIDEKELQQEIHYIHFRLGSSESYGIPYDVAKEVIHCVAMTPLPNVPDFIAGVINWRGALVTLLNLKNYFHLSVSILEKNGSIIVVESEGMTVGIVADYILGSSAYRQSSLDAPLPAGVSIKQEYLYGLHNGVTAIINIHTILKDIKKHVDVYNA